MRGCPETKELMDEEGHGLWGDFGQDEGSRFLEGQKDRGKDGGGCWQLVKGKARGVGVGEGHLFWGHS